MPNKPCAPEVLGLEPLVLQQGVQLDRRFSVELTFCAGVLLVEWIPDIPSKDSFRRLAPAYLKVRDAFLSEVAAKAGGEILVSNSDASVQTIRGTER